jgi:hypothetical protein
MVSVDISEKDPTARGVFYAAGSSDVSKPAAESFYYKAARNQPRGTPAPAEAQLVSITLQEDLDRKVRKGFAKGAKKAVG